MREHDMTEQAYKNGYAKGFEDGKPKWIPVTERLPEPLEIILVYDHTKGWVTDAYMTRHREWVGVQMNHKVTHWMPLPDAPKEG